jgi:hypothetical protein
MCTHSDHEPSAPRHGGHYLIRITKQKKKGVVHPERTSAHSA